MNHGFLFILFWWGSFFSLLARATTKKHLSQFFGALERAYAAASFFVAMVSSASVLPDEKQEGRRQDGAASGTTSGIFSDDKGNLRFVNLIVRRPLLVFGGTLFTCALLSAILFRVVFANGNPITDDQAMYDINDPRSIAWDSVRLARREIDVQFAGAKATALSGSTGISAVSANDGSEVRQQELPGDFTYWVFEAKTDAGVFGTRAGIGILKKAEDMFYNDPTFSDYCKLIYDDNGNVTCERPLSAMNSYYASTWNSTTVQRVIHELNSSEKVQLYNAVGPCLEYGLACQEILPVVSANDLQWAQSLNQDMNAIVSAWDGEGNLNSNITEVAMLHAILTQIGTRAALVGFFYDENFSPENLVSMYSRSIVMWGAPFNVSEASEIISEDGGQQSSKKDTELRKEYVLQFHIDAMDKLSDPNNNEYVNSYYFMGSVIFGVVLDIMMKDALRAVASFVLIFAYLRLNLGSWFLSVVGMMEILLSIPLAWFFFSVVLQIEYFAGLNTLCLFIVAAIGADDIFVFFEAYKQSAYKGQNVLESLESRMNWVYRKAGGAMAVTSATTCSAFLCTVASPIASTKSFGIFAALVIFFDYVLVMTLFCTSVVIYHNRFERQGYCCLEGLCSKVEPSPTEVALTRGKASDEDEVGSLKASKVTKVFRTKVAGFVLNGRNRLVLFILFAAWLVTAGYFTSQLEPVQRSEQDLSKDHPLQRAVNILRERFPRADEDTPAVISFSWGIGNIDRTGVNQLFDTDDLGDATFVDGFTFDEQCQGLLLDMCDAIKIDERLEPYIKRDDTGQGAVHCFIEEFAAYFALGSLDDCAAVKAGEWRNNVWEQPLGRANNASIIADFLNSNSCFARDTIHSHYKNSIGYNGTSWRFAGLTVEDAVLDPWATYPEDLVRDHYDVYMAAAREMDKNMEEVCGAKVMVSDSDQKFIMMNNQRLYRETAISGAFLGVGIAFFVLLLSTRRVVVSILATLSIFCVLISVIGSTTMLGWTLGTTESILICVLAGFSVDYVVHLAHAFVVSKSRDNADKIRDAFGDMGMSVFNGMATSVIASVPLFLCTLVFFVKFGTFLCLTIVFSWVFANLGFMSCLAQIGGCGQQKASVSGGSETIVVVGGDGKGCGGELAEAVVC